MPLSNNHKLTPNWPLLALTRFSLAMVVAVFHVAFTMGDRFYQHFYELGPGAAVRLFLLISGFSVYTSYLENPDGFFRRRVFRIVPVYWLGVAASLVPFIGTSSVAMNQGLYWTAPGWKEVAGNFLFLQPALVKTLQGNLALWTVSLEVVFYLTIPALRRLSSRYVAAMIVGSFAIEYLFKLDAHSSPISWPMYFSMYWYFALGVLLRRYHNRLSFQIPAYVLVVGGALLVGNPEESRSWLLLLMAGGIIVFNSQVPPFPAPVTRVANYLGDLSYPLYVLHWPLAWIARSAGLWLGSAPVWPALVVSVIGVLHVVDRPLRKLGRKSVTPTPAQNSF